MAKKHVNENQLELFSAEDLCQIKKAAREFRYCVNDIWLKLFDNYLQYNSRKRDALLSARHGKHRIGPRGNPAVQWPLFKVLFHPKHQQELACQPVWFFRPHMEVWA